MDTTTMIAYLGFGLAAFSVIGNDVIQTLGTFLSSNEKRPWWVLASYAGVLLTIVLVYGWYQNGGDPTYGRLIGDASDGYSLANPRFKNPSDIPNFGWIYLLPPIILLIITRYGIPVSTTFLILTFFSSKDLYDMVVKSMAGYLVAFFSAILFYLFIVRIFEKRFANTPATPREYMVWSVLQWCSTGFLWAQWLVQDFANIYVYLPRQISATEMCISLGFMLVLLAIIFYIRGGAIQKIVKSKTNSTDIRSATIIDFSYAFVLLFFAELNKIPMSTTWVFIGLLAGRELSVRYLLDGKITNQTLVELLRDLGKVFLGLVISILLVYIIKWVS